VHNIPILIRQLCWVPKFISWFSWSLCP